MTLQPRPTHRFTWKLTCSCDSELGWGDILQGGLHEPYVACSPMGVAPFSVAPRSAR